MAANGSAIANISDAEAMELEELRAFRAQYSAELGLRTVVQHVEHALPPLPPLSQAACKRETEGSNKLRPLQPSIVADGSQYFQQQLLNWKPQLVQAAHGMLYPLLHHRSTTGAADGKGGISCLFYPIGKLLEKMADSGALGPRTPGVTFSWTIMPHTTTSVKAIELAIVASEQLSAAQLAQQQQAVEFAAADAAQEASSWRRQQAEQSGVGPASTSGSGGSGGSSRRCDDVVMRAVQDDDPEHATVIMLGVFKSRQTLAKGGAALNLVQLHNHGDLTARAVLSQLWTYMKMLRLRHAFLSCYSHTWLARICPEDHSKLLLSAPLASTDTDPSAMLGFTWLLSHGVLDVIPPSNAVGSSAAGSDSGAGGSAGGAGGSSGGARPSDGNGPTAGSSGSGRALPRPPSAGTTRRSPRTSGGKSQQTLMPASDTSTASDQGLQEACSSKQQQQPQQQPPLAPAQSQQLLSEAVTFLAGLPVVSLQALGIVKVAVLGCSNSSVVLHGDMASHPTAVKMVDATYAGIGTVSHEAGVLAVLGAAGAATPRLMGLCLSLGGAVACLCSTVAEGVPLSELPRPLPAAVVDAAIQAVQSVHAASVVHGDLRLDHMVFRRDAADGASGSVMVLDFGNARIGATADQCQQEMAELQDMLAT